MAKKSRTYIWQFVIGLGFLSGLWTAIGIDPRQLSSVYLGTWLIRFTLILPIRSLFLILPTILLFLSILGAYTGGDFWGLSQSSSPISQDFSFYLDRDCTGLFRCCHHYRVSRADRRLIK